MLQEKVFKNFEIALKSKSLFTLIIGEQGTGKTFFVKNYRNKNSKFCVLYNALLLKEKSCEKQILKSVYQDKTKYLIVDQLELCSNNLKKKFINIFTNIYHDYQYNNANIDSQLKIIFVLTYKNNYSKFLQKPLYKLISQNIILFDPIRDFDRNQIVNFVSFFYQNVIGENSYDVVGDSVFIDWITKQRLEGNFRDLINILFSYSLFMKSSEEEKRILSSKKSILEFLESRFTPTSLPPSAPKEITDEKKSSLESDELQKIKKTRTLDIPTDTKPLDGSYILQRELTAEVMMNRFRKDLITWAQKQYVDKREILVKLAISEKTYYNWKNLK